MGTAPEGAAVELRVHGVSGGTAEKILDHPIVDRVAGDGHAGFYRPRPGAGAAGGATPGIAVEAYRWGALTAGAAVRTASMLLLLPFMLSNLALRLRPAATGRSRLFRVLCRLLAGTLTAAFVLSVIGVTLDLVGWQCVPFDGCRANRPYLSWLGDLPTGPRLALLALVPLVALRVVWGIGARSTRALEGFRPPQPQPEAARAPDRLDVPGFWDDERTPAWLRQIHVAIGAGTLDASLLAGISAPEEVAGLVLFAAAGALIGCATVLLCLPVPATRRGVRRVLRPLSAATLALSALSLGYAALSRDVRSPPGQLPGYEGAVGALLGAQGVLLVLLALVTISPRAAGGRTVLGGLGMPVVAAASVTVAGAFAATLVFRVADFLDRGSLPGPIWPDPPGVAPLDPPVAYWWAALAGLAALLIATGAASITLAVSRRRRRRRAGGIVERDYPDVTPGALSRRDVVREAIARSHVTDELGPILVTFFLMSSLGLATIAFDLIGVGPTQLVARLTRDPAETTLLTAYVTDGGVWLISLLVIGLMILAFRSYRSAETRRTVAALWDLGDFWPRTVHPFAPPCYAARAVPELARRVSALGARGKVVISGHSHGSVLAAATILQLPPDVLRRVALLTHGCPLSRLYTRLYPAYLGRGTLCDLGDRLDWRWRNLWRDTDPVGGPVFPRPAEGPAPCDAPGARSVDVRLRDPVSLTIDPADTVPPPLERHWPYHTQTPYRAAVRDLTDRIG
ncbi:hypothetical protein GCE86_02925 [Micromonospora terminaliae]|uniref:Integral membrane protein n=1 Tax=Micromonospora terminaliae TaxID=1914461 RepID=A0AAJ3DMA0_9ACTN|nr:hypothetical protein [Micromonospora terminaliae]NES31727.1 hypothetical protein [Micromonospora terminaliae]QGL46094.1 hypothetical protein GCE86_02925 [Micromonospora terminaliae]